jgi:hypothetical protein
VPVAGEHEHVVLIDRGRQAVTDQARHLTAECDPEARAGLVVAKVTLHIDDDETASGAGFMQEP